MVSLFYVILFMAIIVPAIGTYLVVDKEEAVDEGTIRVNIQQMEDYIDPEQSFTDEQIEQHIETYSDLGENEFDAQMKAECLAMGLQC